MASISFQCYSCSQVLKVGAEKAGKRGKCPKCGTALTIPFESSVAEEAPKPAAPKPAAPKPAAPKPAVPKPPPPNPAVRRGAPPLRAEFVDDEPEDLPVVSGRDVEEEEEELDDRPRRKPGSGWGKIGVGLLILFIVFCIVGVIQAIVVLGDLLNIIALASRSIGLLNFGASIERYGVPIMVFAILGTIPGYIMCMLGPNKGGMLALAIVAAALSVVYVMLFAIARFAMGGLSPMEGAGIGQGLLLLAAILMNAASFILFTLYLKATLIAKKRGRYANTGPAMALAIAYAALIVLVVVIGIIMGSSRMGPSLVMIWILLILRLVVSSVLAAFYLNFIMLLWNVRSLVT